MNDFLFLEEKEILRKARALITNPDNWIQTAWARDKLGYNCSIISSNACKFCAEGAIYKILDSHSRGDLFIHKLTCLLNGVSLAAINDYQGHQAVLNAFDSLIGD